MAVIHQLGILLLIRINVEGTSTRSLEPPISVTVTVNGKTNAAKDVWVYGNDGVKLTCRADAQLATIHWLTWNNAWNPVHNQLRNLVFIEPDDDLGSSTLKFKKYLNATESISKELSTQYMCAVWWRINNTVSFSDQITIRYPYLPRTNVSFWFDDGNQPCCIVCSATGFSPNSTTMTNGHGSNSSNLLSPLGFCPRPRKLDETADTWCEDWSSSDNLIKLKSVQANLADFGVSLTCHNRLKDRTLLNLKLENMGSKNMTYEDLGGELNVFKEKHIYCYDRKGNKYTTSDAVALKSNTMPALRLVCFAKTLGSKESMSYGTVLIYNPGEPSTTSPQISSQSTLSTESTTDTSVGTPRGTNPQTQKLIFSYSTAIGAGVLAIIFVIAAGVFVYRDMNCPCGSSRADN